MHHSGKKCFFNENFPILPSRRGFGFKDRNLGEFFPGKEIPKIFHDRIVDSKNSRAI